MPFEKGNKGRPLGSKNKKTAQWLALHEDITGKHVGSFNKNLNSLLENKDEAKRVLGMEMFLKILEYFAPKLSRTEVQQEMTHYTIEIVKADK
jgi:hypothetical protein